MSKDSSTLDWLEANQSERMDALDNSEVFVPARQQFHRQRYEFAQQYTRGQNVADAACGLGYGCRLLKEGGATTVTGIELTLEAVAYAHQYHLRDGIRYIRGDATNLPLRRESIDIVTSFETIEHVPDTSALLEEFSRILKPGGTIILSSPNDWGLTDYHYHTWTPFEFMSEVNNCFEIKSVWEQNSDTGFCDSDRRERILPWTKATERQAECLLIVAKKR